MYVPMLVLMLALKGRQSQHLQRRQRLRHQLDTVGISVAKTVRKAESPKTQSSHRSAVHLFLKLFQYVHCYRFSISKDVGDYCCRPEPRD